MHIDLTQWEESCRTYSETWETLDTWLYDLCKDRREHESYADVLAKTTIIGRTYQTGIERHIDVPPTNTHSPGAAIVHVSRLLYAAGNKVAASIERIPANQPLTTDVGEIIVAVHGELLKVLNGRKAPRSFASKYLHFHRAVVPIYDSYACKALYQKFPWRPEYELFARPQGADEKYYWHVLRFMELCREVKIIYPDATVKQVDYYLLNYLTSA